MQQHTYLRYECADAFGVVTSSGTSSKAPPSTSILQMVTLPGGRRRGKYQQLQENDMIGESSNSIVLTTAGSHVLGVPWKTTVPTMKLGHREPLGSTGGGTGRALNSDQVVCLDVATDNNRDSTSDDTDFYYKVATGWVDGAVRVFDVHGREFNEDYGIVHSFFHNSDMAELREKDEFLMREPLVLNGHSNSPVRSVTFCPKNTSLLASGGSDGSVILWDIVAETGLFRLLGHRGGITNIAFVVDQQQHQQQYNIDKRNNPMLLDLLITTSLDGLVKVWDLKGQCCIQTIPSHRGEVWGGACHTLPISRFDKNGNDGNDEPPQPRIRLLTGSTDGQVRVWSIQQKQQESSAIIEQDEDSVNNEDKNSSNTTNDKHDQVCRFMGALIPPQNLPTSAERISCIHFHPSGKYVGILHANSKTVDVYLIRSELESMRKRQRRLRRRKEKSNRRTAIEDDTSNKNKKKKRGILDDSESDNDAKDDATPDATTLEQSLDPDIIKASDEFEYFGTARASHKIKGFVFDAVREKGSGIRLVCALSTNALEVHSLVRTASKRNSQSVVASNKVSTMNMYGHPTGIRAIELSSDDSLACTVSKNVTKIWNTARRSCVQSISPSIQTEESSSEVPVYGLCAKFLPGNTHVALGTREGHLLLLDLAAGHVIYSEENAHDGAIWSIDIRRPTTEQPTVVLVTGSADKTVKFWEVEAQDDDNGSPMVVQTRTLQMSDDVVAVRYSHSIEPTKRMVFVSTLDSTIKVFFDDTLKFFLSLYGHKLPALAVDASDDDILLASSGADKTIKIWGLDFGDTHRTLHGHDDSVTDLRFVRKTHNFFTTSKDGTVRYWDGDRFEQILLLNGHSAEVNCLTVSRTGAFMLSGGMDRQVRVWERTKDIVFLEEERERELEKMFDRIDGRDEGGTAKILQRKGDDPDDDEGDELQGDNEPQSEAAVKKSVLSVAAGDRIMEALERADQELKDAARFKKSNPNKERSPNLLLLGMEPSVYMLWVLKSVRHAELEQSLLVLPLGHVERLLYYLVLLLKAGRGIEICSRVSIFLVRTHQNQLLANPSMATPLRELRRLIRLRLAESRDLIGFNRAAIRMIARVSQEQKESFLDFDHQGSRKTTNDVWAGLGLGSDVAAALEGRRR